MRYLSVCSGIEAVSVAWQPLGWQPAMFAEIDPFCCWLLRSHYRASRPVFMPSPHDAPDRKEAKQRAAAIRNIVALPADGDVINAGDFTKIGKDDVGTIDLLAGGTPCQSFSVAGKRAGLDDPRGNLTIEFARLADRLRPAWLVWENVPGVLSIDGGRTFGAFLGLLVQLGYTRGVNRRDIARDFGLSYSSVRMIVNRFKLAGMRGIESGLRGCPAGSCRTLTSEQEGQIRRMISDKRPEQLKLDFALWTRAAVMLLIERECAIRIPVRSVGEYLKRWGFTPQKPIRRAYEQSPAAVQKWLDETYPEIKQRAKEEDAEIHWGDETAVVNTDVRGRGYAPKGDTPVAYVVGGTRQKLSMISTVTNQGKASWMIIDGSFNHVRLIEFFEALIKQTGRKVFLVLDNLGVHHCAQVKKWLEEHRLEIDVFYRPSYSPQLNPDERLNGDLKQAIETRVPCRTKDKLRQAATNHMAAIEANPETIKAFFKDPLVKYAA